MLRDREIAASLVSDVFNTKGQRMSIVPGSDVNGRVSVGRDALTEPRSDWTRAEAQAIYDLPFADLIFQAQSIHRRNFDPNHVETASLLSIKTGGCPEDCGYCSQSAKYDTGLKATKLMDHDSVVETAKREVLLGRSGLARVLGGCGLGQTGSPSGRLEWAL